MVLKEKGKSELLRKSSVFNGTPGILLCKTERTKGFGACD